MRFDLSFALLFAARWLTSAIVLTCVLAMLAASCLPVTDASGQVQAIPRWEYWLLHVSVPSAIWWQWTGGLQPIVMTDRLPMLGLASLWILGCYWIGSCISKLDAIAGRLSRYERIGISILAGQSILAMVVFIFGSLLGTAFLPSIVLLVSVALLISHRARGKNRFQTPVVDTTNQQSHWMATDPSFSNSIRRRMVGLLFLATVFLSLVQVYGATIPTHDQQVREVDWWMTKHAAQDGKLRWSVDHTMVNAPAGFNMSSIFFSSLLTSPTPTWLGLPIAVAEPDPFRFTLEAKERWSQSVKTCVLAGKTVNAGLCLIGIFLAAVHLGKRWGVLSGLIVAMVLLSTPGIAELARLGRTEALVGIWGVALIVLIQVSREAGQSPPSNGLLWICILGGALGAGYGSALIMGVPALAMTLVQRRNRANETYSRVSSKGIATKLMLAVLSIAAIAPYLRNTIASGDPISPWGSVLMQQIGVNEPTDMVDALRYAYRVPSETIGETIAALDFESATVSSQDNNSPYRWANVVDGVLRVLGNSNVHGLLLMPLAILGCFCGRIESKRLATAWAVLWMVAWWLLSTRQDRDWVGALFLLAWPVAAGANWMAGLARGYILFALIAVSLAWAVVVIPTWPTSDNRLFVALNSFDRGETAAKTTGEEQMAWNADSYAIQFNEVLRRSKWTEVKPRVLLIGESDDFELLADCASNGPFDACTFDKWTKMPGQDLQALIRDEGFTHLLVVWSGIRYRGMLTGQDREAEYRSTIEKMLSESQLQSIPWEINSSDAELFLVKEE